MDRNPFIPQIQPRSPRLGFAVVGVLCVAIMLAGSALAIAVEAIDMRPITDRLPIPAFAAPADEPRCHATDRIVRSGGDELLRISRFVACEAEADHEGFASAEPDVDCTLDPIGCLIAFTMTAEGFGVGTARVAAFDLARGGSN